jgi:hypothetical protein
VVLARGMNKFVERRAIVSEFYEYVGIRKGPKVTDIIFA